MKRRAHNEARVQDAGMSSKKAITPPHGWAEVGSIVVPHLHAHQFLDCKPGPAKGPQDCCAPATKRALGSDITVAPLVKVSSFPMP